MVSFIRFGVFPSALTCFLVYWVLFARFGKSIIRSCAKLDYDTAQRMIDKKIPLGAEGEEVSGVDWALDRRPEDWTLDEVIGDVLLMHEVGMARRLKRFSTNASVMQQRVSGGALSLHRTKLCFHRDEAGNPTDVFAYPLKDSNR
jgi:DIS3-like exonuclease 2